MINNKNKKEVNEMIKNTFALLEDGHIVTVYGRDNNIIHTSMGPKEKVYSICSATYILTGKAIKI